MDIETQKITADEFFKAFKIASQAIFPTSAITNHSKPELTQKVFKSNGLLEETVKYLGRSELEGKAELYKTDYTIYDNRPVIGNKIEYRQPIYVYALIEHETGNNPEEEFWKLMHHYAPLKVLIFYSDNPEKYLSFFKSAFLQVSAFHPRVSEESYLMICGAPNFQGQKWLAWQSSDFSNLNQLQA